MPPMRNSIIILSFFVIGVLAGNVYTDQLAEIGDQFSIYILYLLMFLVGITVGSDTAIFSQLKGSGAKVLLVPAATVIGTLAGVAIVSLFLPDRSLVQSLMVGSGFGYYSLSSVLITQSSGAILGTISLISNIIRELTTLLLAPIMVRWFSPLAPICCGGATTIDTTLPIIARFSGKDFVFIAILHGVVIDFCVPILVTLFSTLQ